MHGWPKGGRHPVSTEHPQAFGLCWALNTNIGKLFHLKIRASHEQMGRHYLQAIAFSVFVVQSL